MKDEDKVETAFREFSIVATEFCEIVDSRLTLDRFELCSRLYRLLPGLIDRGVALPDLSCSEEETHREISRTRMKQEEWRPLYASLREKFADWDLYWRVFDPTKDSEAIEGSLADDISDIYRDVIEGLALKEASLGVKQDIVFHWRVLYYSHWGQHAMDALYVIHFLLQN